MAVVSVIMPSYNKAAFLSAAVESVINQEFEDWELIIVDDNSSDDSPEIIQYYTEREERISAFTNKSGVRGGSVCRNQGLKKAQGDYVIWLDADDLLAPNCLNQRVEVMAADENLDFAIFTMGTFYNLVGDSRFVWNSFREGHLQRFLMHDLPWQTMMPIWRAKTLHKLGGFDEAFPRLQDVELHTRALLDPAIQYKTFQDRRPDCFYRIEEKRLETGYFDYMKRKTNGVGIYLAKFYKRLYEAKRHELKKLLKGTLFEMIVQLHVARKGGLVSQQEHEQLSSFLMEGSEVQKLLRPKDRWILKLFDLYSKMKIHVPGVNLVTKRILIR